MLKAGQMHQKAQKNSVFQLVVAWNVVLFWFFLMKKENILKLPFINQRKLRNQLLYWIR